MSHTLNQAMSSAKPISRKEETYVFEKYRETKESKYRDLIIKANFRFVMQVASHMQSSQKNLQFDDMVSEGVMGLMHAIETFDHTKGIKFITYAVYWIKYYIMKNGYESSVIAVPSGKVKHIKKMMATKEDFESNVDGDMRRAYNALQFPMSMSAPVSDADGIGIGDTIKDESVDVEKSVASKFASAKLIEIIKNTLNPIKADIILSTYGMGRSRTESTLKELAQVHGMSHERVRQLRKEANYELSQIQLIKELKQEVCA
jgi:RNA polymerase primary sigma factor